MEDCGSRDNCLPGDPDQNVVRENCARRDVSYNRAVKLGQTVCQPSFNASTNQQSPPIGRELRSQPMGTISRFAGQPMGGV